MSDNNLADRESNFFYWKGTRDIAVLVILGVFLWKIFNADMKFDMSEFSFTDLLALLLSFFSVGLSVAFYFKASDASNLFYDNSYRFTSEMSEILGRIEAGFGERLRHLDEGYSGMRERLDKFSYNSDATHSQVQKELEEVRLKEKEYKEQINVLLERANFADGEKERFAKSLSNIKNELDAARAELENMKSGAPRQRSGIIHPAIRHVALKIKGANPDIAKNRSIKMKDVRESFNSIKPEISENALIDMRNDSLLNHEDELTDDGLDQLARQLLRTA